MRIVWIEFILKIYNNPYTIKKCIPYIDLKILLKGQGNQWYEPVIVSSSPITVYKHKLIKPKKKTTTNVTMLTHIWLAQCLQRYFDTKEQLGPMRPTLFCTAKKKCQLTPVPGNYRFQFHISFFGKKFHISICTNLRVRRLRTSWLRIRNSKIVHWCLIVMHLTIKTTIG
jgi:hypothetical protein